MARLFYAWVLLLNRRTDEAHAIVDAASSDVQRSVPGRIARFLMRAHTGRTRDLSAGVAGEVEGAAATSDVFARILAQGYAAAGDRERSMRWLATAVDRGFINHPFLARHDPFLAGLRTHPPFVRLMQVVRRRWERFEA